MTRIEFLAKILKDAYVEFASDSNIVKSMATGVSKSETDEQLVLRALKTRKGTTKVMKFMDKHNFTVDIDFTVITKDGLSDAEPKKIIETKEKKAAPVKEKKAEKISIENPVAVEYVEPKAEEIIVEDTVEDVAPKFAEVTREMVLDKIKYKFIIDIAEEFSSDSIMMKAIRAGQGKGESSDEIISRIARARKDSKRTTKIADKYSAYVNNRNELSINLSTYELIEDSEIKNMIKEMNANIKNASNKKDSVYDFDSINKCTITSEKLLELLEKIEIDFANDSMVQKALLAGRGQGATDTEIIIKCFKTRSTSAKMVNIAKTYNLKLVSEKKNSTFDLIGGMKDDAKINLIFTDKLYVGKYTTGAAKKNGKTLNELALEKTGPAEKQEFSESKDVSELKQRVHGNIIADMFDKDALPYISEQLNEIFKNDTIVKKSFLTSEKNKEGLVGKILRAKKIRPSSANLKALLAKIICDIEVIDDFKYINVEDMKSEKREEANYTDLANSSFKYQITSTSITIYDPSGEVYNASTAHPEFTHIKDALKAKDFINALVLINKTKRVEKHLESVNASAVMSSNNKQIKIVNKRLFVIDTVTNEDTEMGGTLASFIIELSVSTSENALLRYEIATKFLMKMIDNDMDEVSMDGLFKFLKNARIPINTSGNILTYKRINHNYTDCYTGKISNAIGRTVTMERSKVTYDPRTTCASGLHVCSYSYLANFGGARIVICEVEPHNVVSVPVDYAYAKMRCCEYTVKEEVDNTTSDVLSSRTDCIYLS